MARGSKPIWFKSPFKVLTIEGVERSIILIKSFSIKYITKGSQTSPWTNRGVQRHPRESRKILRFNKSNCRGPNSNCRGPNSNCRVPSRIIVSDSKWSYNSCACEKLHSLQVENLTPQLVNAGTIKMTYPENKEQRDVFFSKI